jgi:methylenetetrahydrofolate--tRNA-(uracil-5-)-methyltransferase
VTIRVVGGGLAGCEAAWQAAQRGLDVELYEMRPHKRGPAHQSDALAELVCSNSLRGAALENAVGLLKEELARMGSLIVTSAREAAVPAGGALAVDREKFAALVESRLTSHPRIRIIREEVTAIDPDVPTIVACGPLPSQALSDAIDTLLACHAPCHAERSSPLDEARDKLRERSRSAPSDAAPKTRLHYYDAAAPIVATDSLDLSKMYAKSRYEKGDAEDYLNIPLDREQYETFVRDLCEAPKHAPKEFELDAASGKSPYFEGCLPVEEMAARGIETLRYGPLKPKGLRHPETGITPYAVVQLRKENVLGTAYNLVGFQTRLTWPAQKAVFGKLPGLENAEWLRLGVMHRNSFLDAPRLLAPDLRLRGLERTWFAGQITGAEGYVEAAACGLIAATAASRTLQGLPPIDVPSETALGAIVAHLQNEQTDDFQPANVTWAYFTPPEARLRPDGRPARMDKHEKRGILAQRALDRIDAWREALDAPMLAPV